MISVYRAHTLRICGNLTVRNLKLLQPRNQRFGVEGVWAFCFKIWNYTPVVLSRHRRRTLTSVNAIPGINSSDTVLRHIPLAVSSGHTFLVFELAALAQFLFPETGVLQLLKSLLSSYLKYLKGIIVWGPSSLYVKIRCSIKRFSASCHSLGDQSVSEYFPLPRILSPLLPSSSS